MKWPWQRRPVRTWDVPDTGASLSRQKAERDLEQIRERTREVQAETPRYRKLSQDLREIHAVHNHLAEAFYTAARRRRA